VQIPKASEADKEFFRRVLPDDPRVEVKPMFGNLGAFINGNMFAGLFGSSIGLRLDDDDHAALTEHEGSGPFGPEGRPMGGYLSVPPQWRDDPAKVTSWLGKALEYVAGLPPKVKKTKPRR
jgi:TfoX/Sxy family transcriptional regulator of competence genes